MSMFPEYDIVKKDEKLPPYLKQNFEWKKYHNYRKAKLANKCKNCEWRIVMDHHDKIYHKCKHLGITNGSATDIRIGCVCDLYEREL